jgi:hypothetical protein
MVALLHSPSALEAWGPGAMISAANVSRVRLENNPRSLAISKFLHSPFRESEEEGVTAAKFFVLPSAPTWRSAVLKRLAA